MRQGQKEQLVHLGRLVALRTRGQFEYRYQTTCDSRIVAALSVDVDGVELAFNKRRRSSLMFLVVKSPASTRQYTIHTHASGRTRLAFRNDHAATIEHLLELLQVEVAFCSARLSSSWDDCFLDGQLNDQGLRL